MSETTDNSSTPRLADIISTVADHTTDIAGIVAIAWMATHGVHGYEPYAVVASVAVGKRWFQAKTS